MSNDRSDVPSSLGSTAQYVLWLPSSHTLRIYKTSASSWGTSFVNSETARWLLACTQHTQNLCITFVQCWSNVKTLGQRCTNVIQMFCVWWVAYRYNMFYKEITRIFTWLIVRNCIILHMWVISPYRQDRHGLVGVALVTACMIQSKWDTVCVRIMCYAQCYHLVIGRWCPTSSKSKTLTQLFYQCWAAVVDPALGWCLVAFRWERNNAQAVQCSEIRTCRTKVDLMLGRRLIRWSNINPTLRQRSLLLMCWIPTKK